MKWTNPGHQYAVFSKKKKIYLYGAGECGNAHLEYLRKNSLIRMLDGFLDRDPGKQIDGVCGYPVINPSVVFESVTDDHIVFLCIRDADIRHRIRRRLETAGHFYGFDFFDLLEEPQLFEKIYPIVLAYNFGEVKLSSSCCIPSTLCNLNCRDCLNFTPYIRKFVSRPLNEVCRDEDLFFQWVNRVDRFQISGGEPLLYKDLPSLIEYLGVHYRDRMGVFEVVFNGTVVPGEDVCRKIKDYDMRVILDDYRQSIPQQLDHRKEIIASFERFDISWVDNAVPEWFSLDIENTDNSNLSDGELTEYFDFCGNPWHYYQDGKLYSCNFAAFAMNAGLISCSENDCFDFNQPRTKENEIRLFEFANNFTEKGYVDFCKRCAGWASFNHRPRVPVAVQTERKDG